MKNLNQTSKSTKKQKLHQQNSFGSLTKSSSQPMQHRDEKSQTKRILRSFKDRKSCKREDNRIMDEMIDPERSFLDYYNPFQKLEINFSEQLRSGKRNKMVKFCEKIDKEKMKKQKPPQMIKEMKIGKKKFIKPIFLDKSPHNIGRNKSKTQKSVQKKSKDSEDQKSKKVKQILSENYQNYLIEISTIKQWKQILTQFSEKKPQNKREIGTLINDLDSLADKKNALLEKRFQIYSAMAQ